MPKEILKSSEETKDFFAELPIPQGLNGNEVNGKQYWNFFWDSSKNFDDLATITETYRRMQDLYETINSGRFFLSNAQRSQFPEIYSEVPPAWANDWVKSQYVNSALHMYSASFDIYLQIIWISFGLYKNYPQKCPSIITDKDLEKILETCNIMLIENQTSILGNDLSKKIKQFHLSDNTKEIRNLCKQIKHRQSISFSELSINKHPFMIKSSSYNSCQTLSEYSINDVITKLKDFHKKLVELSNYTTPIVKNKLSITN